MTSHTSTVTEWPAETLPNKRTCTNGLVSTELQTADETKPVKIHFNNTFLNIAHGLGLSSLVRFDVYSTILLLKNTDNACKNKKL